MLRYIEADTALNQARRLLSAALPGKKSSSFGANDIQHCFIIERRMFNGRNHLFKLLNFLLGHRRGQRHSKRFVLCIGLYMSGLFKLRFQQRAVAGNLGRMQKPVLQETEAGIRVL